MFYTHFVDTAVKDIHDLSIPPPSLLPQVRGRHDRPDARRLVRRREQLQRLLRRIQGGEEDPESRSLMQQYLRGSHLSNTTCLTQAFFKSGEECSKTC